MGIGPLKGVSAHRRAHFSNALEPLYDLGGRWSGFRRQIVEYEGYGVSLLEWRGRGGPDLILLHGLGDRGSTWALMLRKLAQGPWGHILVPDLPGFGYSLVPEADVQRLNLDDGTRFLKTLIEHRCSQGAYVVGNSLGGWIASLSLRRHPKQVLGALLLAPAGFMSPDELAEAGDLFAHPDAKKFAQACLPDAPRVVRRVARHLMAPVLKSHVVQSFVRLDSRAHLFEAGAFTGLEHRLRVLWGGQDGILPQSCVERMQAELADQVVIEPSLGHAPQRTRPGLVLRELTHLRHGAEQ